MAASAPHFETNTCLGKPMVNFYQTSCVWARGWRCLYIILMHMEDPKIQQDQIHREKSCASDVAWADPSYLRLVSLCLCYVMPCLFYVKCPTAADYNTLRDGNLVTLIRSPCKAGIMPHKCSIRSIKRGFTHERQRNPTDISYTVVHLLLHS